METQSKTSDVRRELQALLRCAEIDLSRVGIEVKGRDITLSGKVRSEIERQEAECIARRVKGVGAVSNQITVEAAPAEKMGEADPVYEAGLESFPASDPPSWTGVTQSPEEIEEKNR